MDYSQLSDFEINRMVAEATDTKAEETYQFVNGGEDIADHMSGIVLMRKITSNRKHWKLYDPCNNPADAWPIIVGSKINIRFGAEGMASEAQFMQYGHESVEYYHANPLRAAMIVFLVMQADKHD